MSSKKLYKVGITGGIASGKSNLLKYLGANYPRIYTINLDLYGHAVYTLNPILLRNVASIFGTNCVTTSPSGEITGVNREQLGIAVFSSE